MVRAPYLPTVSLPHLEQPSHEVGSLTFPCRRPWGVWHGDAFAQPGPGRGLRVPGATPPAAWRGGCPDAFAQLSHFPKYPAGWRGVAPHVPVHSKPLLGITAWLRSIGPRCRSGFSGTGHLARAIHQNSQRVIKNCDIYTTGLPMGTCFGGPPRHAMP